MDENLEQSILDKEKFDGIQNGIVNKRGWNFLLLLTALLTTFGSAIPAGYNIAVINAPANFMQDWINKTVIERYGIHMSESASEVLWSSVVSIFLIGGAVGSLGGSWFANAYGRKKSYLACVILFSLGAICFQFCRDLSSIELLILGRIFVGLASGLTTTILPMYLSEIAPLHLRGTLGVFCSMGVTGGVVVGQIVSLEQLLGTEKNWHYCLSFFFLLEVISTIPYWWFPESPKYLCCIKGDRDAAMKELQKLSDDKDALLEEIELMQPDSSGQPVETRGIWSVLKDPTLLLPIALVCALQGGQQLSGINAVFYYSVRIFKSIGMSEIDAKWANLGAGCTNLFIAFFSPTLMEKLNRRPLSMLSCLACSICLFALAIFLNFISELSWLSYACVVSLFGYIIFYQLGLGPIPYFIGSELFEVSSRSAAMSLGSLSSWAGNFFVGMTFPLLQKLWEAWVFLIFATVCLLLTIFLKVYLPETRNKDTAEIALSVSKGFQSRPNVSRSRNHINE